MHSFYIFNPVFIKTPTTLYYLIIFTHPDVLVLLKTVTYVLWEFVALTGWAELLPLLVPAVALVEAAVDWGRSNKDNKKNRKRFVEVSVVSSFSSPTATVIYMRYKIEQMLLERRQFLLKSITYLEHDNGHHRYTNRHPGR